MTPDPLLAYLRGRKPAIVSLIRELVECESPSSDAAAVNRCTDLLASRVGRAARIRTLPGGAFGQHLRCEFRLPGSRKSGRILVLGHADTVWPLGTLPTMPFRVARGRLWGPGVFDMKAGLAMFVFAMEALRALDIPVRRHVLLQVNSDEEVGSPSSRGYTEEAARGATAVLVLEPAAELDGKVKTARKGVGEYTVTVRGVAAHAGLDFAAGANAVVEMGRLLSRIAGFTNLKRGITVSPGVISGGSRINVVPDECRLDIDVRVPRPADARYLERRFAALKPFDRRCRIELRGGLNRPPLERTAGVRALYRKARQLAAGLGVELGEAAVGGGSDGNFTAALGVPTLDGLGAVGEGAHAAHESVLLNRIVDRTALLARLVAAL